MKDASFEKDRGTPLQFFDLQKVLSLKRERARCGSVKETVKEL